MRAPHRSVTGSLAVLVGCATGSAVPPRPAPAAVRVASDVRYTSGPADPEVAARIVRFVETETRHVAPRTAGAPASP